MSGETEYEDVRKEILRRLYARYFENYLLGIRCRNIGDDIELAENEIEKIVAKLKSDCLIESDGSSYKITASGIQEFERIAPPTEVSPNIAERQMILNELKKEYDVDIHTALTHEDLGQRINSQSRKRLLCHVRYSNEQK